MTQAETNTLPPITTGAYDQMTVRDVMGALSKRKKIIYRLPLATVIIATALSFLIPDEFRATTKLVPPQQSSSGASALLSQLGGVAGMAAGVAGLKNQNDLYVGMLRSRTVADQLIKQFSLKKEYDTESQEEARKILEGNTNVTAGKDGLIIIEVEGRSKQQVAPMANAYVNELLSLSKTLAVTEAAQRRLFFERQLETVKNNLSSAEIKLKGSLDTHGVISVDAESKAVLETAARLRAQASAKEIQLNSMSTLFTRSNPEYRRVEQELASVREELSRLESGRAGGANVDASERKGGFDNLRLLRDVKYNQMLYEILAKQYELARMDEAKDSPIVQVLDPAVEPERKVKPKRLLLVIGAAFAALLVALGWAIFSEVRRRAVTDPAGMARSAKGHAA